MSSETEKPIERQLREYASSRREELEKDTFALHPVTRNALQVEVEREFGRRGRTGSGRALALPQWVRWVWAGGAVAGLALVAVAFLNWSRSNEELKQLAKVDEAVLADELSANTAKSLEAPPEMMTDAAAGSTLARQEFQFIPRPRPLPTAASIPAQAASSPKPAPVVRAEPLPTREVAVSLSPRSSQPPFAPLQGNFRVSIVADQIEIVDADQSSYVGRLEPIDPASVSAAVNRTLTFEERYFSYEAGGIRQQVPMAARLILTGTNLTSKLQVQIDARMITQTQAVSFGASAKSSSADPLSGAGIFLQIQGTATVQGGPAVSFDASTQP